MNLAIQNFHKYDDFHSRIWNLLEACSHKQQVEFAYYCALDLDRFYDTKKESKVYETRQRCLELIANWLLDSNNASKKDLQAASAAAYAAYAASAATAAAYAASYAASAAAAADAAYAATAAYSAAAYAASAAAYAASAAAYAASYAVAPATTASYAAAVAIEDDYEKVSQRHLKQLYIQLLAIMNVDFKLLKLVI